MRNQFIALSCLMLVAISACTPSSVSQLNALTQTEPDQTRQRAMRRLNLASAYFEQGQSDVAMQEVRAALEIDSQFADAYSLLGLIHQRENSPILAKQSFDQALLLAAGQPVQLAAIQHNLGWFFCQQNRFAEAEIQLSKAASQSGYRQASKTWMALGICQIRSGDDVGAIESFVKSLQSDAGNTMSRYQLAKLDFRRGHALSAQKTLLPLNNSAQMNAESLWLGIQIDHALTHTQDMHKLGKRLMEKFPQSVQAKAWTDKKFHD